MQLWEDNTAHGVIVPGFICFLKTKVLLACKLTEKWEIKIFFTSNIIFMLTNSIEKRDA